MNVLQKFKRFLRANQFYLLFPAVFIIVSLVLIAIHGSFIFEYSYLERVGDQRLYYSLAYKLLHFKVEKNYYTMGYPLLYAPLLLLTGVKESWTSIMNLIIPLQAFFLVPVTIYYVFRNKTKRYALFTFCVLAAYYFIWLLGSADILIKYTFFGLIPLSEPLAIFLLIVPYHIYVTHFQVKDPQYRYTILLAALIAWGLLTRNVSAILYMPLFADLALSGRWKQFLHLGILAGLLYVPQLIYNYLCSKDILFNGYVWKSTQRADKNALIIEHLYGFKGNALFSLKYLSVNISALVLRYAPTLALAVVMLLKRINRLSVLVALFSIVNIVFFLTYWWSKAGGLMDRFLLPNLFLLLFMYRNEQVKNTPLKLPAFLKR